MKHGPIALVNSEVAQETTVFLFILDNDTFNLLMNTLDQMHSRKAYVVVITDCKKRMDASFEKEAEERQVSVDSIPKKYHFMIEIPNLPKINHLLAVVPMQILVENIARIKGINPDMPRNLAKTVTV
jgi:glutamine---fructose-6-phosphate transaminase (isomerizing)